MDLFKSKGSARPSAGSQRGDWKDWFLNREGMAGKFNRRKDEDDWIDYNPYMLFNGGGSVGRDRMGGSYNPRRDPTPNTMGLMQGDLRDTHHYPSGDSSRILAMADERNWDSMPDLADWKQGIGPGARKPIQTIPIFPGTFGDSLEGLINDQTLGNQWAEIAEADTGIGSTNEYQTAGLWQTWKKILERTGSEDLANQWLQGQQAV